MASQYRVERDRGTKDSAQQFAVLREKWPLAFPIKHEDVRPLAIGAACEIAATMGWPVPYTLGVLAGWKMAPVYCQATLSCDQRIALDGAPAEAIDAAAAMVKPTPAPTPPNAPPPETPEQLRARVRASLLRRSS